MTSVQQRRLAPAALAALEEERAFLLRSLQDLEAEHDAGDLDHDDYAELKDDYTRRAALVIRSIGQQRAASSSASPVRWQQAVIWLVGLALLGGISGALIARSSGARSANDGITGGVRASAVTRLNEAQSLLGDQERWDDAIDLYQSVLDDDPSNVEALTYRSWLQYRGGALLDDVLPGFEEVALLDATYPDGIVFQTIVLADAARYGDAAVALNRLDPDTAPAAISGLVDQRGLAGEVYGEAHYEALTADATPSLDVLDLTVDNALSAAGYLLSTERDQRSVVALKLYDAVLAVEPDNTAALSRKGILLGFSGLAERARELVDRAVASSPNDPEALLSRATVLLFDENLDDESRAQACADLETLAALDNVPDAIASQAETLRCVP